MRQEEVYFPIREINVSAKKICQMAQSLEFFLSNLQYGDQNEIWVVGLCRLVLEEFDDDD